MPKKNILLATIQYKGVIYKECIVRENETYKLTQRKGHIIAPSKDCKIINSVVIGQTNN